MKSLSRDNTANETIKKRIIMLFALIPIIALIVACNDIYYEVVNINSSYQSNINELEQKKIDTVNYILEERKNQMKLQNTYVSQQLLHYLYHEYQNNPTELERSLNTRDQNNPTIIIYNNILQTDITILKMADIEYSGETLFICDTNGIIADSANRSDPTSFTWEEIINRKENKKLTRNTINLLLNRSKSTLIWQSNIPTEFASDNSIIYPNEDSVDEIIKKHGLQALKGYNILVPEYIDPEISSPILDVEGFEKVPNIKNRIILVREANLYTILEPYIFDISSYDYLIGKYEENYKSIVTTKIITCLIICGFLICSFLLCFAFIVTSYKSEKEKDDSK